MVSISTAVEHISCRLDKSTEELIWIHIGRVVAPLHYSRERDSGRDTSAFLTHL